MGQTLPNGVYLPAEGERNCYDGLEGNWRSLDGLISTVAGKASATHTHGNITNDGKVGTTANLPLITGTGGVVQAGSFGNQANTFCEGNDSRLSDARTPVAHTHTKSDVTDLFNSANVWSGEQTFSQTIQGNAATASAFDTAKSITLTGAVTGTGSGTNSWEIATVLKTGSAITGHPVPAPYFKIASWEVAPNTYFGAILQIQNKCYSHNTATLTISVRTKTDATFQRGYSLLNNAIGMLPSEFILCYKEITGKVLCELYFYTTTSYNGIRFSVISEGIQNDNSLFNTMMVYQSPAGIAALPSDYTVIQTTIGTYTQDFIPDTTNAYNLGTTNNKWKTLNGINPGALSLPKGYTEEGADKHYINIASVIQTLDGTIYNYTMPDNGWICVRAEQAQLVHVTIQSWNFGQCISHSTGSTLIVAVPFRKNDLISLKVKAVTLQYARFYPMQGNV